MVYLASSEGDPASLAALYDRFEQAYSSHAGHEAELLRSLDACLDASQRARLVTLVDGL